MKSVIKPLAKSVLVPLGLTAATSVADVGIHKKILGSGHNSTTLIMSNNEMEDISKIIRSLEDSRLLLKGVRITIQNEAKKQRGGFLSMLLGTLGASSLGDILFGKKGKGTIRAGEGTVRADYGSKRPSLKKIDSAVSFKKQAYYQNEPRFNGVFSRDNLPNKIKNGAYVTKLENTMILELTG